MFTTGCNDSEISSTFVKANNEMAEKRIKNELPTDYYLIGVATALKEFKFCFCLNKLLHCDFVKLKDIVFEIGSRTRNSQFSVFKAASSDRETHYFVFANKNTGEFLLPEANNFDYLIQIFGKCEAADLENIIEGIRQFQEVLVTTEIPLQKIKNKERLIYEEEKPMKTPVVKRFRE